MKIQNAEVMLIEKQIEVVIFHKKRKIPLDVTMIEGRVIGDFKNGVRTAYLDYFNKNSEKVRQQHFTQIKKYLEARKNKLKTYQENPS